MQKSEGTILRDTKEKNGLNGEYRKVVTNAMRRKVLARAQPLCQENLTMEEICRRLTVETGTTRGQIRRIMTRDRAEHIFSLNLSFQPSKDFTLPGAERTIMAPAPSCRQKPDTMRPPPGLPPYLASLCETPLLTPEQEQHLFRQYNYLKWLASEKRDTLNPKNPGIYAMNKIEAWHRQAMEMRNAIIQANLRLVVSIARKHAHPNEFFNYISDGNASLMRAVECFDYKRGNKFSTYATWVIRNNATKNFVDRAKDISRFRTGKDIVMEEIADTRLTDELQEMRIQTERESVVVQLLARLDKREQKIIRMRFGIGNPDHTLKEVGERMGVTKERVRQLEVNALRKLGEIAEEMRIPIDDLISGAAAGTVEPPKPKMKILAEIDERTRITTIDLCQWFRVKRPDILRWRSQGLIGRIEGLATSLTGTFVTDRKKITAFMRNKLEQPNIKKNPRLEHQFRSGLEELTQYFSSLPETIEEHAPDTLPAMRSSSDEEAA